MKRPENFVSCSKSKHSTIKKVVKTGTTDREIRFANPIANGHALIYHETRDRGKSSHHYGEMLHEHNMDFDYENNKIQARNHLKHEKKMKRIILLSVLLFAMVGGYAQSDTRSIEFMMYRIDSQPRHFISYTIRNDTDDYKCIWLNRRADTLTRQTVYGFFMKPPIGPGRYALVQVICAGDAYFENGDVLNAFMKYIAPHESFRFYIEYKPGREKRIIDFLNTHLFEILEPDLLEIAPLFTHERAAMVCFPYDVLIFSEEEMQYKPQKYQW